MKQEQEASTVLEEEQEDAVIDAITDPYALHLTSLKIENDMQKEAGAIQQNAYDRRVSGYGTIDNKLQVLVKKKADLVGKRKQFAGTNYGGGGGSGGASATGRKRKRAPRPCFASAAARRKYFMCFPDGFARRGSTIVVGHRRRHASSNAT